MVPLTTLKTGDAPQHTQWLYSTGSSGFAHICHFPAKSGDNTRHLIAGGIVITADKHRRLFGKGRIDHVCMAHTVERLYEMHLGKTVLQPLHQGFVDAGKISEHPVFGWHSHDGVGTIDNGFALHMLRPGLFNGIRGGIALYCQHQQGAEFRGIFKRACMGPGASCHSASFAGVREPSITSYPYRRKPLPSACATCPEPRIPTLFMQQILRAN